MQILYQNEFSVFKTFIHNFIEQRANFWKYYEISLEYCLHFRIDF